MTYPDIYFDKDKTKFSHELCQILDEVTHGGPAPCCLWKSRPYVVGPVDSLSGAELGFGLVSEGDPDSFPLKLFLGRILRWPSQLSAHYFDSFFLEDFPVVPVEIDFVSEEPLRLGAEPLLVLLYMDCKVGGLVVGIPAVVVNERVAAYYADTDFSPELDLGLGLAADYWPDMGLMDADYAVFTRMCPQAKHGLLLVVHVYDRLYGALLRAVEPPVGLIVNTYEVNKREDVAVKQRKHAGYGVLYESCPFMLALDDIEVYGAYALTLHSGRPAHLLHAADLVNHTVHVFGPVLDKVQVGRISYLRVRAGGIRLDIRELCRVRRRIGAVIIFVLVLSLFPVPGFSGKFKREGIDVVDGDPLADGREQRGVEDRPVGILCQSAHVLHVGIFLDGEYRLLIGKTELVLDDKGGDNHTTRAIGSPDSVILQLLVIDLLIFRPWKRISHLHPPVGLRQTLKRTLHLIEGQLTVQGYFFHVR